MATGAVALSVAAESAPAIVTGSAALESGSEMFFQLRHRDLNVRFAKHIVTFRAFDVFALRMNLMRKSKTVGAAHRRMRLSVS